MKSITRLFGLLALVCALVATTVCPVNGQAFLTNGLVAYYPFNGNANDAVGTNNGTVLGATLAANRFGIPGAAYYFTNACIRCPDTGFPSGNSPRTVCFWLNIASFMGAVVTPHFGYGYNSASSAFYSITDNAHADAPVFALGRAGGGDNPRWHGPATNVWYHLAVTYTNGTGSLYVNGVKAVQATRAYATTLTGRFYIGAAMDYDIAPPGSPMSCERISDVRIYNRALSAQEMGQLYQYEAGPWVTLLKAVKPSFSHMAIDTNYQLQVSGDMNTWTNQGVPFIATSTNMVYPQYWDVDNWNQLFFRLQIVP